MIGRRACLAGGLALPLLTGARGPEESPLRLEVASLPEAVRCGGRTIATYELTLWNFGTEELLIDRVSAHDPLGAELFAAEGPALAGRMVTPGPFHGARRLPYGRIATVYLEIPLPASAPASLTHIVTYRERMVPATIAMTPVPVDTSPIPVLDAPLKDGPWVAVHAPDWPRGHRRVIYTVGQPRIPGRLAIDFVRVDEAGLTARGDADVPSNALGYGAEVLAVADGRVAAVRDGMAESRSVKGNPKHTQGDAAGNFVSLDIGGGRFAIYEHLKPGSISVKPGDMVRTCQVIGALGFSGDTTGPHLHFHVADAPMPLLGEGKGFVFSAYEQLGAYADLATLGSKQWLATREDGPRTGERPASNSVVRF